MIVVKLGGSLYHSDEIKPWLSALADYSKIQPIIIVPGGGPFADQVRHAQETYQFDDETAHHMAIIAMKQFGLLLTALLKSMTYSTLSLSIWLPDDALLDTPLLTKNWATSSDSIALWLAQQQQAEHLVLIKRSKIQSHSRSICELTFNTIIDTGFAPLFKTQPIKTKIVHYQDYDHFADLVQQSHNLVLP